MLGQSPSQKRDPEPDHRNPKPRCAPNCRSATKAYLHLCEREIREAPRPTAAGVFGGSHGRRQRKGRREAPRPTAAESFGGHHGRRLQAATARDTPRSPPQPPSVTSPFESSRSHRPQHPPKTPAATVRNVTLISLSHRCKYANTGAPTIWRTSWLRVAVVGFGVTLLTRTLIRL